MKAALERKQRQMSVLTKYLCWTDPNSIVRLVNHGKQEDNRTEQNCLWKGIEHDLCMTNGAADVTLCGQKGRSARENKAKWGRIGAMACVSRHFK